MNEAKASINDNRLILTLGKQMAEKKVERTEQVGDIKLTESVTTNTKPKRKLTKAMIEKRWNNSVIIALFSTPLIVAFISMLHVRDLFDIGNFYYVSTALALAYELLLISAFAALRQLKILDGWTVGFLWLSIIILAAMQIFGNIYSIYIKIDPELAAQFAELVGMEPGIRCNRIIAIILGTPLPLTALFFIKVASSFWYSISIKKGKSNGKQMENSEKK